MFFSKKSPMMSGDHQSSLPLTLNDLPQFAIDEILTRLPIKTAIGTSLISRGWRHRWKSIPGLKLCGLPGPFVSQVLLLRTGPINRFELTSDEATPLLDSWLVALSCRNADTVRSLILRFTAEFPMFHLHSAAFSFTYLTTIQLVWCSFDPPHDFDGFKHLQSLHLEKVTVRDGNQLSSLIAASPCLETVHLVAVVGTGCLKIRGPNIRCLVVLVVQFDDFALGNAPLLEYAHITFTEMGRDQEVSRDDGDHSDGEQWLSLGPRSSKLMVTGGIPERFIISFSQLSDMTLAIDFADIRFVVATICLLRSCPNLKKLTIQNLDDNEYGKGAGNDIWDAQGKFDLFPKLRRVEMIRPMFEEAELELARVILETAPLLETMEIRCYSPFGTDKVSAMLKLLEFRRASNQARIICAL